MKFQDKETKILFFRFFIQKVNKHNNNHPGNVMKKIPFLHLS